VLSAGPAGRKGRNREDDPGDQAQNYEPHLLSLTSIERRSLYLPRLESQLSPCK